MVSHLRHPSLDHRQAARIPRISLLVLVVVLLLAACDSPTSAGQHPTPTATAPSATTTPTAAPLARQRWNLVASPSVGQEGRLTAVASLPTGIAWAVGQFQGPDSVQQTLTERWDGTSWSYVPSPSPGRQDNLLEAVAATSATDAWAVGYDISSTGKSEPLIEHWNGSAWTVVPSPAVGSDGGELRGVAARSTSDSWAVGDTGTGPVIMHWDGAAWKVVPSPAGSGSLFAVAALAANNVWAVGGSGGPLIEHWNGTQWSAVPPPVPADVPASLTSISAHSASDIWAVGSGPVSAPSGCGSPGGTLILHWNGTKWSSVTPAPYTANPNGWSLTSVVALAQSDVWAVGSAVSSFSSQSTTLAPVVEHWNGSGWSLATAPSVATTQGLMGVAAGPAAGTVWAVGQHEAVNGSGPTLVEQWSGSTGKWAPAASPSPGTLSNELHGVAAVTATDLWAVGKSAGGTLTEHWDGASWSVVASLNSTTTDNTLTAVAAVSSHDVWAVGSARNPSTPSTVGSTRALIEHWDGTSWTLVPGALGATGGAELDAVAAVSSTSVWAVGSSEKGALVERWDGAHWSSLALPTSMLQRGFGLLGVVALSASDVWVVGGPVRFEGCGAGGPPLIAHWNGAHWSVVSGLPEGVLYGVAAVSAQDIWAVGGSLLLHWNGTSWSPSSLPTDMSDAGLTGVAAHGWHDVWAVGSKIISQSSGPNQLQVTVIVHWNGNTWSSSPSVSPGLAANELDGVATVASGEVWTVGSFTAYAYFDRQALIERYSP